MSKHSSAWFLLACLIVLASCTSSSPQNTKPVSTKTSSSVPTITSTPVAIIPTLGTIPRNCPSSNPTRYVSSKLSPVIGNTPVWATWISGPSVYKEPINDPNSTYDPPNGWDMTKIIWEVGPNYTHTVTLRGYELSDHTPVLVQLGDDNPTANTILDPQHPDHPISAFGDGWAEWGSYIVVPKAGCYHLDVSWSTGHWGVTFAFGA